MEDTQEPRPTVIRQTIATNRHPGSTASMDKLVGIAEVPTLPEHVLPHGVTPAIHARSSTQPRHGRRTSYPHMGITTTEAVDAAMADVTEVAEVAERAVEAAVVVLQKEWNRQLHHPTLLSRRVIPKPRRSIVRSQLPNAPGPLTLLARLTTMITGTEVFTFVSVRRIVRNDEQ